MKPCRYNIFHVEHYNYQLKVERYNYQSDVSMVIAEVTTQKGRSYQHGDSRSYQGMITNATI